MNDKKIIKIDTEKEDNDFKKYNDYEKKAYQLYKLILKETGLEFTPTECKQKDAWRKFLKKLHNTYKDQITSKVKPFQILELQNADVDNLIEKFDELKLHKQKEKPKRIDYIIYAETDEEKERLKLAKELELIMLKTGTKFIPEKEHLSPIDRNGNINVKYIKQKHVLKEDAKSNKYMCHQCANEFETNLDFSELCCFECGNDWSEYGFHEI